MVFVGTITKTIVFSPTVGQKKNKLLHIIYYVSHVFCPIQLNHATT